MLREQLFFVGACLVVGLSLGLQAGDEGSASPAPTHVEGKSIGLSDQTRFKSLSTLCLDGNDNILACDSGSQQVKVISPKGKVSAVWKLSFKPYAIHWCPDGSVYLGGRGVLAKCFAEHLIALEVAYLSDEKPAYAVFTGFLLRLGPLDLWVTAGHVI